MAKRYIERRNGGYYFVGSRISLESVVYAFQEGLSPESIVDDFPTLSLEQVYGGITYYLARRPQVDRYLASSGRTWEAARRNGPSLPLGLRERLEKARLQMHSAQA